VCALASIMGLGEISVSEKLPPRCCLLLIAAFGDDYDALASKSEPSRIMRASGKQVVTDKVLYSVGRRGATDQLGLEAAGFAPTNGDGFG
jgi:hypothetical protein